MKKNWCTKHQSAPIWYNFFFLQFFCPELVIAETRDKIFHFVKRGISFDMQNVCVNQRKQTTKTRVHKTLHKKMYIKFLALRLQALATEWKNCARRAWNHILTRSSNCLSWSKYSRHFTVCPMCVSFYPIHSAPMMIFCVCLCDTSVCLYIYAIDSETILAMQHRFFFVLWYFQRAWSSAPKNDRKFIRYLSWRNV